MIAVAERVSRARVTVDGQTVGAIEKGLLLLLGVARDDDESDLDYIVRKAANLRIFPENGKMSRSVKDIGGAAQADHALRLYEACIEAFRAKEIHTESGKFGADMNIESCGDGPVTILLNSKRSF